MPRTLPVAAARMGTASKHRRPHFGEIPFISNLLVRNCFPALASWPDREETFAGRAPLPYGRGSRLGRAIQPADRLSSGSSRLKAAAARIGRPTSARHDRPRKCDGLSHLNLGELYWG